MKKFPSNYLLNPTSFILGTPQTPDPPPPPGGPGSPFALALLGYLNIQTETQVELSGNNGPGILDGFFFVDYFLDTGVPDQSVPSTWPDFTQYATIREAFEHATQENFRWGYLSAPPIAGEDDPYVLLDNESIVAGELTNSVRHIFPGETQHSTFFSINWARGLRDQSLGFLFSAETGSGGVPSEYDVQISDFAPMGFGLQGITLPDLSANWTEVTTNLWSVGSSTIKNMITSNAFDLFVACNQGEILKSTDNGTTFTNVFDLAGTQNFRLIFTGNDIVCAIDSTGRVFSSENGGTTWTDRGMPFTSGQPTTITFLNAGTSYFIVGGLLINGTHRLFRSEDCITWTEFGDNIGSVSRKSRPLIADVGSGNEVFLYYLNDEITRLDPTDIVETVYQSPPLATSIRTLYVESGLTIYRNGSSSFMTGYNGTTEFTHGASYHETHVDRNTFRKENGVIFGTDRNLVIYGTKTEWLTTDGLTYKKMPTAYDDFSVKGSPIFHDLSDYYYAFSDKHALYKNPLGI